MQDRDYTVKFRFIRPKSVEIPSEPSLDTAVINDLPAHGKVKLVVDNVNSVVVAAWIKRNAENPGASPPDNAPIVFNPGNQIVLENIPGAIAPIGSDSNDNKLVIWTKDSTSGNWETPVQAFSPIRFRRPNPRGTVAVSGKASNWLAFAKYDYHGPTGVGAEAGEVHRPVGLVVPAGKSTLRIHSAAGSWGHCNGCASGPEGLTGQGQVTTLSEYWSADYKTLGLARHTAHFNKLVGLWEINGAPPAAELTADSGQHEIDIAHTGVDLPIPGGATRFFLALHDNYEWDNNVGQVDVDFEWV